MMFPGPNQLGQFARIFLMMTTPNVVLTFFTRCRRARPVRPLSELHQSAGSDWHGSATAAATIGTATFKKVCPGNLFEQLPVRRSRREAGRQGLFLLRLGHPHRAAQSSPQGERALQLDPIREGSCGSKKNRRHALSFQHFVAARRTKTGGLQLRTRSEATSTWPADSRLPALNR
jgi:hypothetical protein